MAATTGAGHGAVAAAARTSTSEANHSGSGPGGYRSANSGRAMARQFAAQLAAQAQQLAKHSGAHSELNRSIREFGARYENSERSGAHSEHSELAQLRRSSSESILERILNASGRAPKRTNGQR